MDSAVGDTSKGSETQAPAVLRVEREIDDGDPGKGATPAQPRAAPGPATALAGAKLAGLSPTYGGPVTLVPQYQQQYHHYQPAFGYTGGYVPVNRPATNVVYNPTFVVQQPAVYYPYAPSPVAVPYFYGNENAGAPGEIGSGI